MGKVLFSQVCVCSQGKGVSRGTPHPGQVPGQDGGGGDPHPSLPVQVRSQIRAGRNSKGVFDTQRAVCRLRSRWRTFLLKIDFTHRKPAVH